MAINFKCAINIEDMKKILLNQEIKKKLSLEGLEEKLIKKNFSSKNFICYGMYDKDKIFGIAFFVRITQNVATVDVAILKKYRGKIGYKRSKQIMNNFFGKYLINYIILQIKKENKASLYFCKYLGFKVIKKTKDKYYLMRCKNG